MDYQNVLFIAQDYYSFGTSPTATNELVPCQSAVNPHAVGVKEEAPAKACIDGVTVECKTKAKKKDKKMSRYYDECEDRYVDMSDILQPQTDLEKSRHYLRGRVGDIRSDFDDEARKAYGLEDMDAPATPTELVKRIQDGLFVIEDSNKDRHSYGYAASYITWRDPKVKKDTEGFEVAIEKFEKLQTKTLDAINILTPEEGLKAVEKLEAFKA